MKKIIMIALAISLCTTSVFAASDSTVFLYHFDGDQKDSSSNNYPAPFGESYSDSFVEGSDYFGGSALFYFVNFFKKVYEHIFTRLRLDI